MLASALLGHFYLDAAADVAQHSSRVGKNAGYLARMQETSHVWHLGKIYSCATPGLKKVLPQ